MEENQNLTLLKELFRCSHGLHSSLQYPGQGRLLILLLENGSLTQRELGEITARRSATLSEQLVNMENAGYVTRKPNEADKRNVDIALTPSGQEAAREALRTRAELADRTFGGFSREEKVQLQALLDRILCTFPNAQG